MRPITKAHRARRAYFAHRSEHLRPRPPKSGTFGKGIPDKPAN